MKSYEIFELFAQASLKPPYLSMFLVPLSKISGCMSME
jgi:hypothetical protein